MGLEVASNACGGAADAIDRVIADGYARQCSVFDEQTRFTRQKSSPDVLAAALLSNLASRSRNAMPSPWPGLAGESHQWPLVVQCS